MGKVLKDHKQQGKKFIPPFIAKIPNMHFTRWTDNLLPEIIWLHFLLQTYDLFRANDLALKFAKTCNKFIEKPQKDNGGGTASCAFISDYAFIPTNSTDAIIKKLRSEDLLNDIKTALLPLVFLYPKCPLSFLFKEEELKKITSEQEKVFLDTTKSYVGNVFNRHEKHAMLAQAGALYILVSTETLKVFRGSGFEDIEEIKYYPNTEVSRKVGSMIRATLNTQVFRDQDENKKWCSYFWQQGYRISPCDLS